MSETVSIPRGAAMPVDRSVRAALAHRDFLTFWVAAIVSNSASWMQMVAVASHLWDQTQSATWLGASGLAMMIPATVLTPFAGVLADRLPRRLILGVTQAAQMCFAFAFFAVYQSDQLTPWRTILLLTANGVVSGIQMAAWQSFVPTLVPRELLVTAVRLNSVQFQASRAVGPLLGALALELFGVGSAFFINAITFIPVVFAVLIARPAQTIGLHASGHVFRAMTEGFRYTWSREPMRRVVIAAFVLSAFGQSLMQLTAAMAAEMFSRPSTDNASLVAAFGVGSVISGTAMVTVGNAWSRWVTLRFGVLAYVLGIAIVPMTTQFWVGIIGLFVCGLAHIPVATTFNTFMQSSVPDEYRGRVVSCYLTGVMLGAPLGSFGLGRLGDMIGMRQTMVVDGVLMLGFAAVLLGSRGGMRFIDQDGLEAGTGSALATR